MIYLKKIIYLNNLLIRQKIKNKKCKKKLNKIKKCLKFFFIVFGIISFSFLLITLILYIKNIDYQVKLSYTNSNSTKDTTITWSTLYNYETKYLEYFSVNDLIKKFIQKLSYLLHVGPLRDIFIKSI